MPGVEAGQPLSFSRPLRIAVLVKQIPVGESMSLGPDRRLVRHGLELEMNAYCRRAVSKGVEWARDSGGTCTVFTLGPPSADDVLREAVAWGADGGVHLCDAAFAGSDTLVTARALSAALDRCGAFDLVLVGRNSLDGDTGQVGPEIAELMGLPFAGGVRAMGMVGETLTLTLELDDGWEEVEVTLPALLSVAERLCEPCKEPPARRDEVPADRIRRVTASDLGEGPWGQSGSPTTVGRTRLVHHDRLNQVLSGDVADQATEAVAFLAGRGALGRPAQPGRSAPAGAGAPFEPTGVDRRDRVIAVIVEPGRPRLGSELLGAASRLATEVGAGVHAVALDGVDVASLGAVGADVVTHFTGSVIAEDVAAAMREWSARHDLWAVLGPSTAFGREVLGRLAAALGAGLVGDAVGLEIRGGELVAAKPAFSGALVADITCTSAIGLVSVRPGVLSLPHRRSHQAPISTWPVPSRGRCRVVSQRRDDDVEVLARAETVIGVGSAALPHEYEELSSLASLLGAELAATRKVTDKGWAPRSRQVGLTGRSISPRLYVALALSGKFNHMVGVRGAGTIVAVNIDPEAPVFAQCDIGIVGDWHVVVPALVAALRAEQQRPMVGRRGATT